MARLKMETYASVWDAIADTPEEAENLRVCSDLMTKITTIVEKNGWPRAETARRCGVTRPRSDELMHGRISRFSLDALVAIAASLGLRVRVTIRVARGGPASQSKPDRRKLQTATSMRL